MIYKSSQISTEIIGPVQPKIAFDRYAPGAYVHFG